MKVRSGSSLLLFALGASLASAQVKCTLNAKDGENVGLEKLIVASVESKLDITQVEFYVNNELRETDDSLPYEFHVDGLAEPEGPLTLKAIAYNAQGKSTTVVVKLVVDNGLAAGPDSFVKAGDDLFRAGKLPEAMTKGRLALKAKKDYNPARLLMAKVSFQLNQFDRAETFAQDVLAVEPNNLAALDVSSASSLQQAFNLSGRTANRDELLTALGSAFSRAAKARNRAYQVRIDAFGLPTDDNILDYADLCLRAGRNGAAVDALTKTYAKDRTNSLVANRLFYALLRAGKGLKAADLISGAERRKELDGTGFMIAAIQHWSANRATQAMESERQALLQGGNEPGVKTGQAYLALSKNRTAAFAGMLQAFSKESDAPYQAYASQFLYKKGEYEMGRRSFEQALLAEPILVDAFLNRAAEAVDFSFRQGTTEKDVAYYRRAARMYLLAALDAKPESFEALSALAILSVTENKNDDAITFARAATKAGPEYGGAYYTLGMVSSLRGKIMLDRARLAHTKAQDALRNGLKEDADKFEAQSVAANAEAKKLALEADEAMKMAGKCDPANLQGRMVPQPNAAWVYVSGSGRTPLLLLGR